MILVIDDDPRRVEGFRKALGPCRAASSCADAANKLRLSYPYTTIYLDFDGVDGQYLADLLAEQRYHYSARIIIHSSNYTGAINMRDTLARAGYDVELKPYSEIVGDDTED